MDDSTPRGGVRITSDRLFRTLFEAASDAIVLADESGNIALFNPAACAMFGYEPSEVLDRPIAILMPERFRADPSAGLTPRRNEPLFHAPEEVEAAGFDQLLEVARREGRVHDEGWRVRKDGSKFWADVAITGLCDPSGTHVGFAQVTRDLTERRRADDNARRLLNERAARLTAERLEGEAREQAHRLQILAEASRLFATTSIDPDGTLNAIAHRCAELVGDTCVVQILSRDGEGFLVRAFHDRDAEAREFGIANLIGVMLPKIGISARVAASRSPILVSVADPEEIVLSASPPRRAFLQKFPVYSVIAVPLFAGDEILGTVTLARHSPDRPYGESDLSLMQDIADRAGLALENARLFQREVETRREAVAAASRMARLQATTAALSGVLAPVEAANVAMDEGLGLFGAASAATYLASEDGKALVLVSSRGIDVERLPRLQRLEVDSHTAPAVAFRNDASMFFDSREDVIAKFPELAQQIGPLQSRASFNVPLRVHGRCIGVMGVGFENNRTFSRQDRTFAEVIGDLCAQAMDRALLAERERSAIERTVFLARGGELLASSLDEVVIPRTLVKLIVPRLASWCAVEMADGESTRQVAVAHEDPSKERLVREFRQNAPPRKDSRRGAYEVLRTGKIQLHQDLTDEVLSELTENREQLELARSLGVNSVLLLPVVARGTPIGVVTLVSGAAERRFGESEVQLATELVRRAALAIENARVYHDLELAVRVRDDFLAVASHELKTPLAAALLHTQSVLAAARKEGLEPRLLQRLAKCESNTLRLDRLVNELLDVSRITSGRLRLDLEPINLSEVVREVVTNCADSARRRGCSILPQIEPDIRGVLDRMRVQQVAGNLVENAVKYGQGKPVEIELTKEGTWATLRVSDHGIGIEPEKQSRIFDRFERAVTTREFGGFGLGLWIVRQIVEATGGEIGVASAPGRGSTFIVRLPLG